MDVATAGAVGQAAMVVGERIIGGELDGLGLIANRAIELAGGDRAPAQADRAPS